jgi:hypothetical protein
VRYFKELHEFSGLYSRALDDMHAPEVVVEVHLWVAKVYDCYCLKLR